MSQAKPEAYSHDLDRGEVDITPLLGTWTNSNPATSWIKRFTIARKDGKFTMHTYGAVEPFDWGEVEITTYKDKIGELAFRAVYDLEPLHSVLAANTNKGLIIIVAFHRRKNGGGRQNFFCREFYFHGDVQDE